MRVFKVKWFARFARQEAIRDDRLCEAIDRAERGLIDADLGGNVIKQRVARPGRGRSGGYRVLIACERSRRAVFLYAFAKNERANIDADDLPWLQSLAAKWLSFDDTQLQHALEDEGDEEVFCG